MKLSKFQVRHLKRLLRWCIICLETGRYDEFDHRITRIFCWLTTRND